MLRTAVFVVLLSWVSGIALAHDQVGPSTIADHPLDRVSNRIHVVHATRHLPDSDNRGFMNNPAAILTDNGVIIVDPGSSREIGRQLLEKIRTVSDKPVIAVFNTHVHGDHWLGNHGIREVYPDVPIYAHERTLQRAKAGEGEFWVDIFMRMTKGAVAGTRPMGPTIGLKGGETLMLDGVTLRTYHTGHAHSDGDLMIEVVNDKGLFFGDIVTANQVPNSDVPQDASFKGSIVAIRTMLEGDATLFIPGHGRSGGREIPETSLRFLEQLQAAVTKYFKQGLQDYQMKELIVREMDQYKEWKNFNEMGRVISFVYQEVEKDNF